MGDVVDDFSNDFAGIGNEEDGGVSQNYRSDGTISWPTTLFITLTPIFAIVGAVGHTLIFVYLIYYTKK